MEEGGHKEGHEMRNAVKSSPWLRGDSRFDYSLQARNREDGCRCRCTAHARSLLPFTISGGGKKKKMKSEAAESHKLCKENLGEARWLWQGLRKRRFTERSARDIWEEAFSHLRKAKFNLCDYWAHLQHVHQLKQALKAWFPALYWLETRTTRLDWMSVCA